ncbi:MarR family winged helix-turn-helix transcriptional regulator [Longispora albida]|uniref:MarR family winged helix-turn-helix transcriptional regulator n=1 Tax=Longispora albida TaxID=203523 RepID=UPI0004780944|nr:MarR family transcriptional regulator [Longispora albida]
MPVKLEAHLAYLLSAAERAMHRDLTEHLGANGLNVEQWRILSALAENPGQPMGDLAAAVLMPHPTVTKAVDRLVDAALVYRRHDPADRRKVVVYLSERGAELQDRGAAAARGQQRAVQRALGAGRAERLMQDLADLVRMMES